MNAERAADLGRDSGLGEDAGQLPAGNHAKACDGEGRRGIVSEWKSLPINQLGEVVTGKTPSKDNPEDWGREIPFVTPSDYKFYSKKASFSERNLSIVGKQRLSKKIIPCNSVLVTCIGSDMGKVVMNAMPVVTNQQVNSIIPNTSKIDSHFLYYALLNIYDILKIYGGDGTAVPIVNKGDFGNIEIEFPHIPEQKSIASVLSSLDDKIDLLHRQNKTLEAMAEALFRQWFVEEAQDDWKDGCLADFAVNVTKSAKISDIKSNDIYIGLEHIERRNISLAKKGVGSDVESNKYYFRKHDILFGKLRPYFHKVCFAPFDGICSTDILVIRPKEKYLFGYCLFSFFRNDIVEYANLGSGGTRMPRTNWEMLSRYPVAIPEKSKLMQFNEAVCSFIGKIEKNQKQIRTLEHLRDTLLPKLMSGEVRVNHDKLHETDVEQHAA